MPKDRFRTQRRKNNEAKTAGIIGAIYLWLAKEANQIRPRLIAKRTDYKAAVEILNAAHHLVRATLNRLVSFLWSVKSKVRITYGIAAAVARDGDPSRDRAGTGRSASSSMLIIRCSDVSEVLSVPRLSGPGTRPCGSGSRITGALSRLLTGAQLAANASYDHNARRGDDLARARCSRTLRRCIDAHPHVRRLTSAQARHSQRSAAGSVLCVHNRPASALARDMITSQQGTVVGSLPDSIGQQQRILKPQRQHRRALLSAVPDRPTADAYVPPTPAQRAAAQSYMRTEPIIDSELQSAMETAERHLRKSDLARLELAQLEGEHSTSWDTMSRIIAVALARLMAQK